MPCRGLSIAVLLLAAAAAAAEDALPRQDVPRAEAQLAALPESDHETVEHLLRAADHLEAAGLTDAAARLRAAARDSATHDELLGRKEAELECLQREIDRLRELTGQTRSVLVRVTAFEFSRRALKDRARELDELLALAPPPHDSVRQAAHADVDAATGTRPAVVEGDPAQSPLFRQLCADGLISIVAEPTLVTTSQRPAAFHSGGQFPVEETRDGQRNVRMVPFGVRLDLLAAVLSGGRIRMQVRLELSDPLPGQAVKRPEGRIPAVRTTHLSSEVELRSGQTAILGQVAAPRRLRAAAAEAAGATAAQDDDRELVVLITPQLANPAPLQPVPSPAVEGLPLPEGFDPTHFDLFGPVLPVMRRGTPTR